MKNLWCRLTVLAATMALAMGVLAPLAYSQPATLKIVSSLPRTGSAQLQTDAVVNGIRMALAEVGSQAGGFTIVYEDLDDATAARGAWDPAKEAENASLAMADPSVVAYVGTFNSGAARIAIPILCQAGLVMISPANTYPGLTKQVAGTEPREPGVYYPNGCGRNYTRVTPSDELQGAVAAGWSQQLGATSVFVLSDGELYGYGLAMQYLQTASEIGLTLAGAETIDPRAASYLALAERVAASGADLVYFGGITQNNAGQLWRDLRAVLGADFPLMAPDGLYEMAFVDQAGAAADGTYLTFGALLPWQLTGRGATWYEAYRATYGIEPEAYAAYGYEAASVALDAIRRAGSADRTTIRDAVFATADVEGVLGTWSFDANGDTTLTSMSGRQIVGGQFDDANAVVLSAP